LEQQTVENLTETIVSEIKEHMGNAPQFDDVTVLAIGRK